MAQNHLRDPDWIVLERIQSRFRSDPTENWLQVFVLARILFRKPVPIPDRVRDRLSRNALPNLRSTAARPRMSRYAYPHNIPRAEIGWPRPATSTTGQRESPNPFRHPRHR